MSNKPATADAQEPGLMQRIVRGSTLTSILAVVVALIIGGLIIALTNQDVWEKSSYFFARPGDTLGAAWDAASKAYVALFQGGIYSPEQGFKPIAASLTNAAPLILTGLGVAVAFRSGLFNIGAQGQIILGGIFGVWAGFAWSLPSWLHIVVVILMAALGGAVWGGIVGWLKAVTGAHEVILTIMLNYVALKLLNFVLTQAGSPFKTSATGGAVSKDLKDSAHYPDLIPGSGLDLGFLVAIIVTIVVWWLMSRSTLGLQLRAVGENPHAARTAGINVKMVTLVAMLMAGALAGMAAPSQLMSQDHRLTGSVAASIGFDAITVALLGRSTPIGTFFAGLLFGAFKAGGIEMQRVGLSSDIVLVVQSLIVLFIAAPPLIRAVFGLNKVGRPKKRKKKLASTVAASTEGGAA
ncbi:ABC transporter permease [Galactobacter sp.]|uniref:ABC transporter permease n=1 Tax=Galactobacter sp. TaxID=2676125 RepID=UPI0025B7C57C|nr:ABC transporter permease [Galactobacter sp.]